MTAIAGLVHNGIAYIGGDSAGVGGWSLQVRADTKVFRNGPYVCGFTSSFRMGQLIRYGKLPRPGANLERFMATTFVDAVRETLKVGGWATRVNEHESGGQFLVGVAGRLFAVYEDYQVAEPSDGIAAVGCGQDLVLGALYATAGEHPKRRIQTALEAAERFSAGVRGPFITLTTTGRRWRS